MKNRVLVFLFAGTAAVAFELFFIEASNYFLNSGHIIPRMISLPIAIIFTWYINRRYGFKVNKAPTVKEFLKYLNSNFIAQSTNFFLYLVLISYVSTFQKKPFLSLIIATSVSVLFSFLLYSKYVFAKKKPYND